MSIARSPLEKTRDNVVDEIRGFMDILDPHSEKAIKKILQQCLDAIPPRLAEACGEIARYYRKCHLPKSEKKWLYLGASTEEKNISFAICCYDLSFRIKKQDPEKAAYFLYQSWPYWIDFGSKTKMQHQQDIINHLQKLTSHTKNTAQLALTNIYLEKYQENKEAKQLEPIFTYLSLFKNNYHTSSSKRRNNIKETIRSIIALENNESKEEKVNKLIHQTASISWNLEWKDYEIALKENAGLLTKLFTRTKKPGETELQTLNTEHNLAVDAFFNTEDKSDKHFRDAAFGFTKIAEKTGSFTDAESKKFSVRCYHLAGISQSRCHEKKDIYLLSAAELYVKAHCAAHETKLNANKILHSLCNLEPSISELKGNQQEHYTDHLLKCFSNETVLKNIKNMDLIGNTLLTMIHKKPLLGDQFFWLNILSELTETTLKLNDSAVNEVVIAILNKLKDYVKESAFPAVKISLHDKLADLLVTRKEKDHKEILAHRKATVLLATEEKHVRSHQPHALNKKYTDSLIDAGDYYRTHSNPTEARSIYQEARDSYHDTRALLGLAKLASSSSDAADTFLAAIENANTQKNEQEFKIALKDTCEFLLPLMEKDSDRIKIETALCTLFERNYESKSVADPSPCVKILNDYVSEWLTPDTLRPVSEVNFNKILIILLNSRYKKENALLKLIGNYSLQRTGASKDPIARKAYLILSEQSDISLVEKRELLGRVVALDTDNSVIARRISEISFLIEHVEKIDGLKIILQRVREDKVTDNAEHYQGSILQWIKQFGITELLNNHLKRDEIFHTLATEITLHKNPLAIFVENALINHYISTNTSVSLALAIKFMQIKVPPSTAISHLSQEEINLRISLLDKMFCTLHQPISLWDTLIPKQLMENPYTECLRQLKTYSNKTTENKIIRLLVRENIYFAIHHSSGPQLSELFSYAKKDMLPALIYLSDYYKKTDPASAALFSIKILMLTTDSKQAADRHQLPETEVINAQKNALYFLSLCANNAKSGLQEIAVFGMQLFSNPELPGIMFQQSFPGTQEVITAALRLSRLKNEALWMEIIRNEKVFTSKPMPPKSTIAEQLNRAPLPATRHKEEKLSVSSSSSSVSLRSTSMSS